MTETNEKPKALHIYTDGSCLGNPGYGGWAYIVTDQNGKIIVIDAGAETHTTNNQMEMWAVFRALNVLGILHTLGGVPSDIPTVLFCDSEYTIKGMTDWREGWQANGMKTGSQKPVKNSTLWKILYKEADIVPEVSFRWVRGHNGNPFNETVDLLAKAECEKLKLGVIKPTGPSRLIKIYEDCDREEEEKKRLELSSI